MSTIDLWKGYRRATTGVSLKGSSIGLVIGFFFLFYVASFVGVFSLITPLYDFKNWSAFQVADGMKAGYFPSRERMSLHYQDGTVGSFSVTRNDEVSVLADSKKRVETNAVYAGLGALPVALVCVFFLSVALLRYQSRRSDSEFIRGGKFADAGELSAAIKRLKNESSLMLGNIPMLRSLENRHMGFSGDTGTGKSQALLAVVSWAKAQGHKGVIVDKTGEFTQHLFNPETDKILSPFDDRSVGWMPYNEGEELFDFERLAKSFVPLPQGGSNGNEHWPEASLTVLSWLFYRLKQEGKTTIDDLVDVLTVAHEKVEKDALGEDQIIKIRGVNELLKGTLADMVIDPSSPEHAMSVIGTLVPKIRSFWYLRGLEEREQFSFREWAADDSQKGWVFIRVTEDQLDSVNPVVTAWIDTLVKAVLSLPKSSERVIWAAVDELQSFEKINSLGKGVFEGRKHGLRMLLGFASVNELQDIYGEKPVKSIMSMLGTKLVFRTSEPDAAEWNSKMLLEEDVMSEQQGISFGTNDNLNASDRRERQALVTASEIATIPDLTAFLRFAGDWPTSKATFTYKSWPEIAVPFVPRSLPAMQRHSVEETAEATNSPLDGIEPLI
ncbi:type IV secretion system DNA-binding domain-containing protein [Marinobacter salarius]|uniref:type IV secretion system DNA-binding domain-containing protein n=1 Tax=Marinobacter salarius TaxID=1420917 RepID=UPI001257FCCD|nr:type IV secretion system DNA-binding domain-containing protein [Marinobacter salarius]VVT28280.1 conserved hypothetical protein [Marinobacter salarius]